MLRRSFCVIISLSKPQQSNEVIVSIVESGLQSGVLLASHRSSQFGCSEFVQTHSPLSSTSDSRHVPYGRFGGNLNPHAVPVSVFTGHVN